MNSTTELFRALELAHYAQRFRSKRFVIALPQEHLFHDLLLDLKVLGGYGIQVVLVVPDADFQLDRHIRTSNKRGTRFHLSLLTDVLVSSAASLEGLDFGRLARRLDEGRTPVIAHHLPETAAGTVDPTFTLAGEVAAHLGADKLFLVTPLQDILRQLAGRSHLLPEDLPALRTALEAAESPDLAALLPFIEAQLARGTPDVIVLGATPGLLFREVFTHEGAGVLFNRTRASRIRQADIADVTDVALLLRPEMATGRILPIDENTIERNIRHYWVYEIDGLLVCSACLKLYGDAAELAQFAALPRYRGKGRARELALRLIDYARGLSCRRVFALSLDERMWDFFTGLGFRETAREDLPAAWRAGYDLSRPSRAFLKEL